MASKSLNIPHRFAAGTIVRAYPRDATVPNEPPDSNSLDQATVAADGTLTFTNLPSDAYLTAFARVDGEYRYFPFTVGDPSLGSSESSAPSAISGVVYGDARFPSSPTSITQGGVTTTYTYDASGNVLTETRAGKTATYAYDGTGNLTGATVA